MLLESLARFGATSALLAISSLDTLAEDRGPEPDPVLLQAYLACEEVAARRVLAPSEAAECSLAFVRVKLSFLPGVGLEDYAWMDARDRARVNREGYAAFTAWRARASELLAASRADIAAPARATD